MSLHLRVYLHVDLPSNIVAKIQQRRDALASNTVEDTTSKRTHNE